MRGLRPAFFILAALGTALGAAAVTTVLSVARATLPSSLPYRDAESLVVVWDQLLKLDLPRFPLSTANYLDYRARQDIFTDLAAFQPVAPTLRLADRSDRVNAVRATPNLLSLLGVQSSAGRWFLPTEHQAAVAVITHTLWQSRFGSDPEILTRLIVVDGVPHQVIGVLPANFQFRLAGEAPDLFLPLPLNAAADRNSGALRALGRLRAGLTLPTAQTALDTLSAQLKLRYRTGMGPHGEDGGYRIWLNPLTAELYGPLRASIQTLAAAAVLLLLLGLINTALLWLGRAATRQRDASIRLMLGASPVRVALHLSMETLAPTVAGGLLALGISAGVLRLLNAAQPPELSAAGPVSLDVATLLAVLTLSGFASVTFGVLPLRSLLFTPSPGRRTPPTQSLLIGAQAALVCAILAPSLLLVRSLTALQNVDPGFAKQGLLTAAITLPETSYPKSEDVSRFYSVLESRLEERFPAGATLTSQIPLGLPSGGDPFSIEGRAYGLSGTVPQVVHRLLASRHYAKVLQLRQVEGRGFEERDFAGSARICLVNETLARGFFPGRSAIGQRVLMGAPRPGAEWITIAGVVADMHTARLDLTPIPQILQPFWQSPNRTMAVIVRGATPADLRQILAGIDPQVPAYRIESIKQHLAGATAAPRLRASIFSAYAVLAFLLAAFGIYSLTAWSIARRLREFALRSALGATPVGLSLTILGRALRSAAVGSLLGLTAAFALARALSAQLYRTSPGDPAPYLVAAVLVMGITGIATLPAVCRVRAANPAELLRAE